MPAADLTRGRRRFVNNSAAIYTCILYYSGYSSSSCTRIDILYSRRVYILIKSFKKKKNLANRKYHDHTASKQNTASSCIGGGGGVLVVRGDGGVGNDGGGAPQWPI